MNLPGYDFFSAPLDLITLLHVVTLTLHFLAMNFLFGGLVTILFGPIKDRWNNPAVQKYVKLLPSAMAATVTLGVAPLLFVQLVYPKQIYSAAIVSAWFWLAVPAVAILAYYLLYAASFKAEAAKHKGLYLGLAALGFTYISFTYSSVFSLAENQQLSHELYAANQSGWQFNTDIGSYILRWLHTVTGAITVGGFFVGWIGKDNAEVFEAGKKFFLWGMVVASVLGFAYMGTLGEMILPFMRSPAIWAVTIGALLSAGSLHMFFKKKFIPAGIMVLVSVLLMVFTRHTLRLLRLADHYDPSTVAIEPVWSMVIIFVICFVIAIGTVWYMLKLFFAPSDS